MLNHIAQYITWKKLLFLGVLLLIVALIVFFAWRHNPAQWISFILNKETRPGLFILLMAVLPIFGFPISVFLFLAGIKFGIWQGMLLTALIMPVHMVSCYYLSKTLFCNLLQRITVQKKYRLPDVPKQKMFTAVLLFLTIPGPPYISKNYILAMTDISFIHYLGLIWIVQCFFNLPVVGLGGAIVEKNWVFLLLFVFIFALLFSFRYIYRRIIEQKNSHSLQRTEDNKQSTE